MGNTTNTDTGKRYTPRRCVGCGQMKNKKDMIRVSMTSDGEIAADPSGRGSGRGAYLCPSGDCLVKAVRNKGFERSFKRAVPKEIYVTLEKELKKIAAG